MQCANQVAPGGALAPGCTSVQQVVHLYQVVHLHQVALAPGCSVQQGVALGIIGRLDVLKPLVMSARAAAAWLPILPSARCTWLHQPASLHTILPALTLNIEHCKACCTLRAPLGCTLQVCTSAATTLLNAQSILNIAHCTFYSALINAPCQSSEKFVEYCTQKRNP